MFNRAPSVRVVCFSVFTLNAEAIKGKGVLAFLRFDLGGAVGTVMETD